MLDLKQKAEELVEKYSKYDVIRAKDYALIACNRTIDILKQIRDKEHSDNFWCLENAILEEMQVKTEIEKL